jgi:carbon-monoxide dehydrogenase medium subunit
MYNFKFHRAQSTADAAAAFASQGDASYLAGGQTLLASLKLRLARPDTLVDLGRIPELRGIQVLSKDRLAIGSMSTHAQVASSDVVASSIPALTGLASGIGDPMIRHQGTIGGSIANNDPAADWPAALLALDGVVVTDQRRISAADFFLGLFTTALQPGELIVSVELAVPTRCAYVKFKHPASRFALVGVMVADFAGKTRVAVTGAAACAFRATALEQALDASCRPDSLRDVPIDTTEFNADLQATAAYRGQLVRVMAQRAVERLVGH